MIMKRTISILLASVFALAPLTWMLASCQKGSSDGTTTVTTVNDVETVPTTPKELYQYATQKLAEADNYRVNYKQTVTLSGVKEFFVATVVDQNINESREGKNVVCKLTQSGQKTELSHIDGMMYLVQDGTKAKAKMTWKEFVKYFEYERPDVMEQLPDSVYANLTVTQSGEEQILKFKLNVKEMRSIAGNLREFLQLGADSDKAEFQTGTYTVHINKDGKVFKTSLEMDFKVVYKYKECICYVTIESTVAYDLVKVKVPKDAAGYVDITGQL
jgi:hypothetical protein